MVHPLLSCRAKIDRAQKHFETLNRNIKQFFDTEPHPVLVELKLEDTKYIARVHITRPVPRTGLGFLIGDCVHNARSALDHLLWGLSEWFSGHDPTDKTTQFPIFADPGLFDTSGRRMMQRVPTFVQTLIEKAQPCNRSDPDGNALWWLHNLDVTDKHKVIPVTTYLIRDIAISNMPVPVVSHWFRLGPFEDGAIIGELTVAQDPETLKQAEMKMRPRPEVDISFRPMPESGDLLVTRTLRHILWTVERKIVPEFDALLNRHYGIPSSAKYDLSDLDGRVLPSRG